MAMLALPTLTDLERARFEARIQKTDTCWNWTGSTNTKGYGRYHLHRRSEGFRVTYQAHRASYELHKGIIPGELTLDHLCRNRRCVNPDHLEPVSERENILRGTSPSAVHATTTHCPEGHPFDGVERDKRGNDHRRCSVCKAVANARHTDSFRGKKRKPKPTKEVLAERLHEEGTWSAVARDYGVTDVAVRKWAVGYGLPSKISFYRHK